MVKIIITKKSPGFFLVICFFIIGVSCKSDTSPLFKDYDLGESKHLISFDITNQEFSPSAFFNLKDMIVLEEIEGSSIERIDKIDFKDSLIIVSDYSISKILVFNRNGKFLYTIGTKGKGAEEYLSIYDVDVYKNSVFILDLEGRSFIEYTTEGEFVQDRRLPFLFYKFDFVDSTTILTYNLATDPNSVDFSGKYKMILFDIELGQIIDYKFPYFSNHIEFSVKTDKLMDFEGYNYFHPKFSKYIYKYNWRNNSFSNHYEFDFNDEGYSIYDLSVLTKFDYEKSKDSKAFPVGDFFELDDDLFISLISYQMEGYFSVYDIKERESYTYKNKRINSLSDLGFDFPLFLDSGNVVSALSFFNLNQYLSLVSDSEIIPAQIRNIKNNQNPVLFIYELKEEFNLQD